MNSQSSNNSDAHFLKFIAYLQIIGIIFVVFGHSFHEYPDGNHGFTLLAYRMMYSFRMPLFMFVSGFLMVFTTVLRNKPFNWGKFSLGKVRRLMVPFIVLTAVTFIPRSLMSGVADDNIPFTLNSFLKSFYDYDSLVIPFFWFLQSSFTLLLISYLILTLANKLAIKDYLTYTILVILFAGLIFIEPFAPTFFSLNRTCEFSIFFALGAAYGRYHEEVDRHIRWTSIPLFVLFIAVWVACFIAFEHTLWMPVCSVAGILMCISAAKLLEYHNLTFLDHLIGTNYIIFLLSWYFNILSQQVLHHFVALPWWVHTILSLTFGLYVPWLFYQYMLRHPDSRITFLARHLLGQSFKHKK